VLRSVAHESATLQHRVAPVSFYSATLGRMGSWKAWRQRAKDWKRDRRISDADIAQAVGVERGTVNSWLNKREPNLSDFMALCEAMKADPAIILFGLGNLAFLYLPLLLDVARYIS